MGFKMNSIFISILKNYDFIVVLFRTQHKKIWNKS